MKAVIIEDETTAVNSLKAILAQNTVTPIEVIAELESIEESVEFFRTSPHPDIIFMDIHLADGSAFKIFEQVEIDAPVVFTTAYDEYALQAFQVSSIDYLLKPVTLASLCKKMYWRLLRHVFLPGSLLKICAGFCWISQVLSTVWSM